MWICILAESMSAILKWAASLNRIPQAYRVDRFDQVKLKVPDVFDGRTVQRFFDKVGEPPRVVGVGIDGVRGEVTDLHVPGESSGDRIVVLFVRAHGGSPGCVEKQRRLHGAYETAKRKSYNRFNRTLLDALLRSEPNSRATLRDLERVTRPADASSSRRTDHASPRPCGSDMSVTCTGDVTIRKVQRGKAPACPDSHLHRRFGTEACTSREAHARQSRNAIKFNARYILLCSGSTARIIPGVRPGSGCVDRRPSQTVRPPPTRKQEHERCPEWEPSEAQTKDATSSFPTNSLGRPSTRSILGRAD